MDHPLRSISDGVGRLPHVRTPRPSGSLGDGRVGRAGGAGCERDACSGERTGCRGPPSGSASGLSRQLARPPQVSSPTLVVVFFAIGSRDTPRLSRKPVTAYNVSRTVVEPVRSRRADVRTGGQAKRDPRASFARSLRRWAMSPLGGPLTVGSAAQSLRSRSVRGAGHARPCRRRATCLGSTRPIGGGAPCSGPPRRAGRPWRLGP